VSIKEYIEDNGLNITLGRTKTNLDLLNEIEDALAGDSGAAPAEKEEEEEETPAPAPSRRSAPAPAKEEEEDDDEPADTAPAPTRRQRSDDTNEPAVRTERRAARPARRR